MHRRVHWPVSRILLVWGAKIRLTDPSAWRGALARATAGDVAGVAVAQHKGAAVKFLSRGQRQRAVREGSAELPPVLCTDGRFGALAAAFGGAAPRGIISLILDLAGWGMQCPFPSGLWEEKLTRSAQDDTETYTYTCKHRVLDAENGQPRGSGEGQVGPGQLIGVVVKITRNRRTGKVLTMGITSP